MLFALWPESSYDFSWDMSSTGTSTFTSIVLSLPASTMATSRLAPPSVAAGIQRVGRAGHSVGEVSRGVVIPKFRGDLLEAAAVVEGMLEGRIESTTVPRKPLDVLAQQIVAM